MQRDSRKRGMCAFDGGLLVADRADVVSGPVVSELQGEIYFGPMDHPKP